MKTSAGRPSSSASASRVLAMRASVRNVRLLEARHTAATVPVLLGVPERSGQVWSRWSGSNRRPTAYKAVALPLSYTGIGRRTCAVLGKSWHLALYGGSMTQLIAEQLLLLAYRPDGTARGKGTELDMGLGGALLAELAVDGHVEVGEKEVRVNRGRSRPEHPVLAAALAEIEVKALRPRACVLKLARGARREVLAALVGRGVLTEESRRVFGVFPGRRFPVADPAPREEALGRLRAAVIEGAEPDQRTAALAGLVQAAGLARRVFPDDDQRAVKARLKEIAEGDRAAEAVRRAIRAARAATAATTAGSAGAAGGGGVSPA